MQFLGYETELPAQRREVRYRFSETRCFLTCSSRRDEYLGSIALCISMTRTSARTRTMVRPRFQHVSR